MARFTWKETLSIVCIIAIVITIAGVLTLPVGSSPGNLSGMLPGIIVPIGTADSSPDMSYDLTRLTLPPGFSISIYAVVPGARSLAYSPEGTLFVGTRGDSVYAVRDTDGDGYGESVFTVASGLFMPNGVALLDGDLYVAEVSRVLRFPDIESQIPGDPRFEVIRDDFPSDRSHGWKFIRFGPDGMLYIPVGAPCNICMPPSDWYAAIFRMSPDGSEIERFASGVRNTVGFDWDPATGDLWFTDNGRDWMGDDLPPDELNHAPEPGLFFGYPYRHGTDVEDPEFGPLAPDQCKSCVPPVQDLGPHVASLGMRFYSGSLFPSEYHGSIFIAEHGSWNRRVPIGYRVTEVRLDNGTPVSYTPFIDGWLKDGSVSGRPVDVEVLPDGNLLISDDYTGVIYLVSYLGD